MKEPNGYYYNHSLLLKKVKGMSDLSTYSRHALRDLLDKIWESDNSFVKDKDIKKYVGYSDAKWDKVKLEISALDDKFIKKEDDYFTSPWLMRQKGQIDNINNAFEKYDKSYEELDDIESIEDFDELLDDSPSSMNESQYNYNEDETKLEQLNFNNKKMLFSKNTSSLGVNSRASILSNNLMKKYKA